MLCSQFLGVSKFMQGFVGFMCWQLKEGSRNGVAGLNYGWIIDQMAYLDLSLRLGVWAVRK
jgi:hypothetical protein